MKAAQTCRGDLPQLLDMLTVAVTTLDAVGVEGYRELYLYIMGTAGDDVVRDLRVEDGQLIVGPPTSNAAYPAFMDHDFEGNRRALLLADLCYIMRIWKWSLATMADYLHCSEAMLSTWIGRSSSVDVPTVPKAVIDRIKRLLIIDQARFLSGIADCEMPCWLTATRKVFGQRSIEEILFSEDGADYAQLVMWGLNSEPRNRSLH